MYYFLPPLIAGVATQIIKLIIEAVKGRFSWNRLNDYGGMPSSHSAFVLGLLGQVGIIDGIRSTAFAITLIFSFLTIRDALGLRQHLSHQAKVINQLIKELPDKAEYNYDIMPETVGHTVPQIIIGGAIGLVIVILMNYYI